MSTAGVTRIAVVFFRKETRQIPIPNTSTLRTEAAGFGFKLEALFRGPQSPKPPSAPPPPPPPVKNKRDKTVSNFRAEREDAQLAAGVCEGRPAYQVLEKTAEPGCK